MQQELSATPPASEAPEHEVHDPSKAYEELKLNGLIRNGGALAALVIAYSMDWMNLAGAGRSLTGIPTTGVSVSALSGARQSVVLKPADMEVFGIPLTMAFFGLLIALILRVVYPQKRRLHPLVPLTLAAPGTVMLGVVLWRAFQDETAQFFISGFYVALAAFTLNTVFDFLEYLDWRGLGKNRQAN